ncbi:MAG TPA: alpha/beta hydrolase, partial [Geminicoccaceae bacterium]|nr:alpha/beta hydrolase [Geminicoccaceae bacterium]
AEPFRTGQNEDLDLWEHWDRIACPVLVLRGAESDLLPAATAREMTRRGPKAELIEFEGVGHAPALMAGDQIAAVVEWLRR